MGAHHALPVGVIYPTFSRIDRQYRGDPMRYEAPVTVDAASKLLLAAGMTARVLAGGTDLLVQVKTEMIDPELVIDLKRIPELRAIKVDAAGFHIGAAVTGAELKEHPSLKLAWPGVVEAANLIGSTQIQGRASLGGNLCNASPAADSVPALIAAGATVSIHGPKGTRMLPVEDVVLAPRKTALQPGEFVGTFHLAAPGNGPNNSRGDAYLRFIPRTEMDIAVVGCGIALNVDSNGVITSARVGLGAVAPRPLLVQAAGTALIGTKLGTAALDKMIAAVRAACAPIDDKRGTIVFRTEVAGVIAGRTADIAYARATGKAGAQAHG
jgi:CO/xanthine dehydrogenase FAD-binding subunit